MLVEISDGLLGALIFVILVPLLYFTARLAVVIYNAWKAFRLYPMATAINGRRDPGTPYLKGRYQEHTVRVAFAPNHRLNGPYSNSFHHFINAFYLELHEVPGQQDWAVRYGQKQGLLSEGPMFAFFETKDPELAQRLEEAGVLTAISAVGGGTTSYETVRYNAHERILYYLTNVAPATLPSQAKYCQQLDLLVHLAEINRRVNTAVHAPA